MDLFRLVVLIRITAAFNSNYATFIPTVADQTGLPIDSSSQHQVSIPSFTSSSADPMVYQIATTFDETTPGTPSLQLDGAGPSLTITLNTWSSKFAVCVVFRDTNVPSKSYGCAPFFVEPVGHSDPTFCTTYPDSCYCDSSCVQDFSHFCQYYNWIPPFEPDIIAVIDQNNLVTPREHQLSAWQFTQPTESAQCPETFENSVEQWRRSNGVWEKYQGANLFFDSARNVQINTVTERNQAGQTTTFAFVDPIKMTGTNPLKVRKVLDCSDEINLELDKTFPDWLTSSDPDAQAFTVEADGSLTSLRMAHELDPTIETFTIRSARTHTYCETNFPVSYSDFNTSGATTDQVSYDPASLTWTFNWHLFSCSSNTVAISLRMTNGDGLDVVRSFTITLIDCSVGQQTQPNIMYFINQGASKNVLFSQNTMIDTAVCTTLDVQINDNDLSNYWWLTEIDDPTNHGLTIDPQYDATVEGLYNRF